MAAPGGFDRIARREEGLQRRLTAGQMSMIAIGGAIGTGLFLGRVGLDSRRPSAYPCLAPPSLRHDLAAV